MSVTSVLLRIALGMVYKSHHAPNTSFLYQHFHNTGPNHWMNELMSVVEKCLPTSLCPFLENATRESDVCKPPDSLFPKLSRRAYHASMDKRSKVRRAKKNRMKTAMI